MILGRIIGVIFGFLLTAPMHLTIFGILVGYFLGKQFDKGFMRDARSSRFHFDFFSSVQDTQYLFFDVTFAIMGHIAKSDGHVSKQEIHIARQFMAQLKLSEIAKKRAIKAFNQGKSPDYNYLDALRRLRMAFIFQPALMQLFLDIQVQAAQADGTLSSEKKRILSQIHQHLGVAFYQYGNQQNRYQHNHRFQSHRPNTQAQLKDAYQLLGVTPQCSHATVKKAYKKQMGANHPDRLISKGLPEEMIKLATHKTQQIKQAYELICQQPQHKTSRA